MDANISRRKSVDNGIHEKKNYTKISKQKRPETKRTVKSGQSGFGVELKRFFGLGGNRSGKESVTSNTVKMCELFSVDIDKIVSKNNENKVLVDFDSIKQIKNNEEQDLVKAYVALILDEKREVETVTTKEVVEKYNAMKLSDWVEQKSDETDHRKSYLWANPKAKSTYTKQLKNGLTIIDYDKLEQGYEKYRNIAKNNQAVSEFCNENKIDKTVMQEMLQLNKSGAILESGDRLFNKKDLMQVYQNYLNYKSLPEPFHKVLNYVRLGLQETPGSKKAVFYDREVVKIMQKLNKQELENLVLGLQKAGISFDEIKYIIDKTKRSEALYKELFYAYTEGSAQPDCDKARLCVEQLKSAWEYCELCRAYLSVNDFENAQQCANMAGKEKGRANMRICEAYLELKPPDFENAKKYAKAAGDWEGSANADICKAYLKLDKPDFSAAEKYAEASGEHREGAYLAILEAYLGQKEPDFEVAVQYAEKAGSDRASAYERMSVFYINKPEPDFETAEKLIDKAGKDNHGVCRTICQKYLSLKNPDFKNAMRIADISVSKDSEYRYICLAYLKSPIPDFENAIKYAENAGGYKEAVYANISNAYAMLPEADLKKAAMYAELAGDSKQRVYNEICRIYLKLKEPDFDVAKEYAEKAGSYTQELYYEICKACVHQSTPDYKQALICAEKAGRYKANAYNIIYERYIKEGKLDDLVLKQKVDPGNVDVLVLSENQKRVFYDFLSWDISKDTYRNKALRLNSDIAQWIALPHFKNYAQYGLKLIMEKGLPGTFDPAGKLTPLGYSLLNNFAFKGYLEQMTEKLESCLGNKKYNTVDDFINDKQVQSLMKDGFDQSEFGKQFITSLAKTVYARNQLYFECQKYKALSKIPKEQLHTLLLDGKVHFYGMYAFENEPGYITALFNGLTYTLQNMETDISAGFYDNINKKCIETVKRDTDRYGFRELGQVVGYGVGNASEEGLKELRQEKEIVVIEGNGKISVETTDRNKSELFNDFNLLADAYEKELKAAQTDDEKITAIVRFCQKIERRHFCCDGNIRTSVFCVMNSELVKAGFGPTIFNDPNDIDGLSVAEVVQLVKSGQEKVEKLKG